VNYQGRSYLASILALALFIIVAPTSFLSPVSEASKKITRNHLVEGQGPRSARVALDEGKAQLRRFKLYAALGPLEEALRLYTQAGDKNGIGAACDALGDLYEREGQYAGAKVYYQRARDAFLANKETANANLVLAKLGETYLLNGEPDKARAAFALFSGDGGSKSFDGRSRGDGSSGFAALLGNSASGACSVGSPVASSEPPFLGHGPLGPNRSVRMDLRLTDEGGNPVRNAQVKLKSERPPGLPDNFVCDCAGTSDQAGRYLAPPIHAGDQLSLNISAKGFQPVQTQLPAQSLSQPVRITLATSGKSGAFRLNSAPSPATCFDLYKSFFAYALIKLTQGRANYQAGQLDDAEADFRDLLATASLPQLASFKGAERFRAAAATSLGDISFRRGDLTEARKLYSEAIDRARRDNRLDLSWAAHAGLGRTLWALSQQAPQTARFRRTSGRLAAHVVDNENVSKLQADSLTAYREALKDIETIIEGSVRADEARTTFLATTHQVFVDAAGAMAEMALAAGASSALSGDSLGFAAEAFKVTEEGRSRSLLDLLSETGTDITEGVSPDLLKRKTQNLAQQQEIAQQLTGTAMAGESPKQTVAALETQLVSLAQEFDSIENQIRTTSPRYSSLVRTRPLTLSQVQDQVLDDQTALLEYCLGEQASYLWVVTRSNIRLFKLAPRAQIERLAMDFRAQVIPPKLQRRLVGIDVAADEQRGFGIAQGPSENVGAFAAASNALFKAIIEPTSGLIGNQRLLVVADGALNYISFEALVSGKEGADYASLSYLIKTNEVTYAPSASVIAAIRQRRNVTSARNLLLVADPVFRSNDPRLKGNEGGQATAETRGIGLGLESAVKDVTGQTGSGLQLARLSGTRTEAEEIDKIAGAGGRQSDLWIDLNASEDNVRNRDITNYRVVHIATHGLLDAERPQFTGVVLSLVGNKANDGFLRTDEIFNLKLGAPLVMLSACETGLGKEKRGEGVIGLTRAFMYAGAPTVGVSLWSVADKSTAELMTNFYRHLLDSSRPAGPASAMRDAQLTMIAGKKYSAPFYWAPFVLVGEWR
jgi:CHAT domain-containing protein/tetratricopeptide (TPR) repeat protein